MTGELRLVAVYIVSVAVLVALDFIFVAPDRPVLGLFAGLFVVVMGAAMYDKARHERNLSAQRAVTRSLSLVTPCPECFGEKRVRTADDTVIVCDFCYGEGVLR